ncbi:MAG TPA: transglycosylase SLT domain-containing protein [Verrucomicrobiae bacterium]|nr:transglycosylase SLT domain-containing protein [Verrucomicrobiae bacterium]
MWIPTEMWRPARALLVTSLVVRGLMPTALVAPATAVAAGPDDADPSPRLVRVSVEAQEALYLTRTEDLSLTIASSVLQPIQVGTSEADARVAAEAAARVEAERVAAEQARIKAEEERKAAEARRVAAAKKAAEARKLAQAAPASVNVSPVTSTGRAENEQIVREAAAKYGVDVNLLLRIGMCESGLRSEARNKSGSAASGMFQFMPSTFRGTPQGKAGMSIFDPRANAEAAAWKISQGGLRAWNASKHCWNR